MKWRRTSRWHYEADEGGYRVSLSWSGIPTPLRFSAWGPNLGKPLRKGTSYGTRANLLGVFDSPQAAQAACRAHWKSTK